MYNWFTSPHSHARLYTVSQKGTPTLSTVTLERINGFQWFLAQVFLKQLAIKGYSIFHLTQHLLLHYLGKTEQTKYAPKWTTNVNKLEIRSHKNLITVVWVNEVHCLLTFYSTSCHQTCRWWHVRVQRDSAPANRRAKRSNCWSAKPQILSLRICGPPTALTSIWSITRGVGRYVGFTPMWERTICGIRAGELDITPLRGIGNTRTRLHSYG